MSRPWIVCQIGAREHYVLAAELHRRARLAALCTDIWAAPGSPLLAVAERTGASGRKLRERYDAGLADARVFTEPAASMLARRVRNRLRGVSGWDAIMAANRDFGRAMSRRLRSSGLLRPGPGGEAPVVFAYSYAARRIFETARAEGCTTILGQIDPGPVEDRMVAEIAQRHGLTAGAHERPPQSYWDNWREECALADRIVVNSPWSRSALIEAGVDAAKIAVVPLAYTPPGDSGPAARERAYPPAFDAARPMRLLFLGQINVRKGAVELLQAMEALSDAPVRLTLVGQDAPGLRDRFGHLPNVDWAGPAPRGAVADYYSRADAFILPTHSDGFALTQLEAAAYGLPLLVSAHCGEVVEEGVTGLTIDAVSAPAIEAAIRRALDSETLAAMSARARDVLDAFAPGRVVDGLIGIAEGARP